MGISRASLTYRPQIKAADLKALAALDETYTRHPFYGSRRLRIILARDYGLAICRDHVRRLMRCLGLTTLYPKQNTSRPAPGHLLYPYLLKNITAQYPNQVWGADITYIRLAHGYCYLMAILDWYSRYVLAWTLSPTLEADFCVVALTQAIDQYGAPVISNTDQGSQFTAQEFIGRLHARNVRVSMDGRGRCLDNIFTERLWRSVKYEEVYLKSYTDITEARSNIAQYFQFYNEERPHMALQDQTPAQVYAKSHNKKPSSDGLNLNFSPLSSLCKTVV